MKYLTYVVLIIWTGITILQGIYPNQIVIPDYTNTILIFIMIALFIRLMIKHKNNLYSKNKTDDNI